MRVVAWSSELPIHASVYLGTHMLQNIRMSAARLRRITTITAGVAVLLTSPAPASAQHQHPPAQPADTTNKSQHAMHDMKPADTAASPAGMAMSMNGPLGISMERMGSGTTWIPDAVTLPSRHFMVGNWMIMAHGFAFGQYTTQSGPRGDDQLGSLNWAMIMADRALRGGRFQLRFMPSLDALTVGECGYPLVLQAGETCNGKPIVDRQHPHEFFMELAALYEREVTRDLAFLLYAAPAGEPALGPVAFMHRPSAMDEPQVPLGHHWQDVTHTAFGVVTAGVFTRRFRLEGSVFNGFEPDENRWDFDRLRLNSYSGRVTYNPTAHWSLTTGYGYLNNPERHVPDESMHRLTVSAMHGRKLGMHGQWATSFIYGGNKTFHERWSNSLLAESEAVLDGRNTIFGRAEYVEKNAHELGLEDIDHHGKLIIESLSLGYVRELLSHDKPMTFGVGIRGTVNYIPKALENAYGSRTPVGGMVFVRLRPNHPAHGPGAQAQPHH